MKFLNHSPTYLVINRILRYINLHKKVKKKNKKQKEMQSKAKQSNHTAKILVSSSFSESEGEGKRALHVIMRTRNHF